VLTPYREARFQPHAGPFVFKFQRHGMIAEEFFTRLDDFIRQLPKEFRYAVEIRKPGQLGPEFYKMLEAHPVEDDLRSRKEAS